jgi:hypothetical protein
MKRLIVISVLSAALGLAPGPAVLAEEEAEGGIHECTDANGQLVYQDEPCVVLAPTPAKPATKSPPKTAAKSKAKSQLAATTTATTTATATQAAKPAKVSKTVKAPPPESDPKNWVITPPPGKRRVEPAPTGRSLDGRMATPEKTLQTFVEAVKAGDRPLVLSCLTSGALADLGPDPPELPMEKLRQTVDSFTGYVPEGDLGPYWSIRAQRGGLRPKWIFFERTGSGDWKIAAL